MLARSIFLAALALLLTAGGLGLAPARADDVDGDGVLDEFDVCDNTPAGTAVDGEGRPLGDTDHDCDTDLDDFALSQWGFTGLSPEWEAVAEWEPAPEWEPASDWASIPAGEFQMGNCLSPGEGWPEELPVHAVYVDAFYMDTCEVTNAQYAAWLNWAWAQGGLIIVTSGVVYKYAGTSYPYCDTTTSSSSSRITWDGSTFRVVSGKENHPMVEVSWYGSVAYANWRSGMEGKPLCYDLSTWTCNFGSGYRLPTEAEWEKAARGGAPGHRFPWSDTDTIQHARANYYSSSSYSYDTGPTRGYHPCWGAGGQPYTSPVGFFTGALQYKTDWGWAGSPTSYQTTNSVNGYGLYDMAGNVCEWCNDWYSSTYYSSSPYNNPHGPTSGEGRVLRGGGWYNTARRCRCAYRLDSSGGSRTALLGFRLALDSE